MSDFLENIMAFEETVLQKYSCFHSYHYKVYHDEIMLNQPTHIQCWDDNQPTTWKGSPKREENCWHLHFTDGYKSMERLNAFPDVLQEASLTLGTRVGLLCRSSAQLWACPLVQLCWSWRRRLRYPLWSRAQLPIGTPWHSGKREAKGAGSCSLDLPWKGCHGPLVGNTLGEMSHFSPHHHLPSVSSHFCHWGRNSPCPPDLRSTSLVKPLAALRSPWQQALKCSFVPGCISL